MRIVHLDLAGLYTENTVYQTNMLAYQNFCDGHETIVVSSTFCWEKHKIVYSPPCDKWCADGIRLIRLPYANPVQNFQIQKVRKARKLLHVLDVLSPDVIVCHGSQFYSILDVIRYKKKHPSVKFYADTHTATYNSGKNWLSLHILHRIYYRWLTQKALPYLEKYFYIGESERLFSIENYGVPEAIMEYYPLGGTLLSDEDYQRTRAIRRQELEIADDQHLYIHSGKMGPMKRTKELLEAFSSVDDPQAVLVIIGSIPDTLQQIILPLIEADSRVKYLGWKSGEELQEYLCACDLYCQPGSVSATMQNAVCRNCAIMAYPHLPYTTHLDWGNILWVKSREDMESVFRSIAADPKQLPRLKQNSRRCAEELLDYRKLAARLYE